MKFDPEMQIQRERNVTHHLKGKMMKIITAKFSKVSSPSRYAHLNI